MDGGGWPEKSFLCDRFRPLSAPFFLSPGNPPMRRGAQLWGPAVFGVCQSPTPSRQPPFETSDRSANVGSPSPQSCSSEKLYLYSVESRGIFVNFFAAFFPGNCRTKICKKIRQNFVAFFADLLQKFRENFALGERGHKQMNLPSVSSLVREGPWETLVLRPVPIYGSYGSLCFLLLEQCMNLSPKPANERNFCHLSSVIL